MLSDNKKNPHGHTRKGSEDNELSFLWDEWVWKQNTKEENDEQRFDQNQKSMHKELQGHIHLLYL